MDMESVNARIGVVMLTYNRCDELLTSLAHLSRLPEKPRIVLVDNASTDGTVTAVAGSFPNVTIVRAKTNLGAAGRNLGIAKIAVPYVALCDDDTWWHPGALRRATELMDRHERLAVITGRVLVGHTQHEDPTCRLMARSPLTPPAGMPRPSLLGFLAGASVIRRAAFQEVGGFPRRAFIGGEEQWVAIDLAARGWHLCYVPELIVYHHPSPQRDSRARSGQEIRNAFWFAWLRRPWSSALRRSVRLARLALRDWPSCTAFAGAVAGLPWLLRERRVVPLAVERGLRLLERG
jgi:GT2 family glycosyltransferase